MFLLKYYFYKMLSKYQPLLFLQVYKVETKQGVNIYETITGNYRIITSKNIYDYEVLRLTKYYIKGGTIYV